MASVEPMEIGGRLGDYIQKESWNKMMCSTMW